VPSGGYPTQTKRLFNPCLAYAFRPVLCSIKYPTSYYRISFILHSVLMPFFFSLPCSNPTRASNNSARGGERLREEILFPDTLLPPNSLFFLTKRGTSPPNPTCSLPSPFLATDPPVLWMVLHQPQWSRLVACKSRGFLLYSVGTWPAVADGTRWAALGLPPGWGGAKNDCEFRGV
jgi:hypothetical protein